MRKLILILFTFCILSGSVSVLAQSSRNRGGTTYTVSGNIKADGVNLEGALVFLMIDGNITESDLTDAAGNYSLTAIEGIDYAAGVFKDGFNFNPSFQNLGFVQKNQIVNFQNGTELCTPAPFGQTVGNFCENAEPTNTSPIENGLIAYEVFGNAFAVNADGSNQAQLPPAGSFPSWSFDGTRVLSNRDPSNDVGFDQEIFAMNADGSSFSQLTVNDWSDFRARFSPDGSRIVFDRLVNTGDRGIYTMDANGANETRLTPIEVQVEDASFSPDGSKIVYTDGSQIFVMNANGSSPTQLTFTGPEILNTEPSWSPDGLHILFISDRGGEGNEVWRMTATGSELVALTGDEFDKRTPVYSPDGTIFAFSRLTSLTGFREIYTKPLFGGVAQRMTFTAQSSNAENPSWQRVVGNVVTTIPGAVTMTFSNVQTAGNTVATPIAPASAGRLPQGFGLIPGSVAFDLRTSAVFTGDIEVCFTLNSVDDEALFGNLVIFHNEDGALVDRTTSRDFASRRICATVSSLSPFVVAAPVAPTAASFSVAGKVLNARGSGIPNAIVSITDSKGNVRTSRTTSFGFYRFDGVAAGQTYLVDASSRRFGTTARIITVSEDWWELDFVVGDQ